MTQTPEITADAVGPSDAELITAVRSGDQEAFGELFARHQAAARGLARQLVRDPNEADDLVSESFAKILQVLRGGGGPDAAFRAYLYTTVRRVAYDRTKAVNRVRPTDDLTPYDAGVPFVDPALEGLEKTLVASAFRTLPERWQAVLWHTEVEGLPPAQVGVLLGLTANGVSALAYRAREGLRQAYLQQHLAGEVPDGCAAVHDKLGAYARGGLSRRETAQVDEHLEGCPKCRALVLELTDVSHGMRVVIGPLILGTAGIAALKAGLLGAGMATIGHVSLTGTPVGSAPARWFSRASQTVSGAGMPAIAASVVTVLVVGLAGAAFAGGLLTGNNKANLDAVSGPKNVASGQAGTTPSGDLATGSGSSGPHVITPSDGSGNGSRVGQRIRFGQRVRVRQRIRVRQRVRVRQRIRVRLRDRQRHGCRCRSQLRHGWERRLVVEPDPQRDAHPVELALTQPLAQPVHLTVGLAEQLAESDHVPQPVGHRQPVRQPQPDDLSLSVLLDAEHAERAVRAVGRPRRRAGRDPRVHGVRAR